MDVFTRRRGVAASDHFKIRVQQWVDLLRTRCEFHSRLRGCNFPLDMGVRTIAVREDHCTHIRLHRLPQEV